MLIHRLRRWPNIKPALGRYIMLPAYHLPPKYSDTQESAQGSSPNEVATTVTLDLYQLKSPHMTACSIWSGWCDCIHRSSYIWDQSYRDGDSPNRDPPNTTLLGFKCGWFRSSQCREGHPPYQDLSNLKHNIHIFYSAHALPRGVIGERLQLYMRRKRSVVCLLLNQ